MAIDGGQSVVIIYIEPLGMMAIGMKFQQE